MTRPLVLDQLRHLIAHARDQHMHDKPRVWRCQCPNQCGDEDGMPCFDDVTQEDFLCDWCRRNCTPISEVMQRAEGRIGQGEGR